MKTEPSFSTEGHEIFSKTAVVCNLAQFQNTLRNGPNNEVSGQNMSLNIPDYSYHSLLWYYSSAAKHTSTVAHFPCISTREMCIWAKTKQKYSCKQQLPGPSSIRWQDMPTLLKVSDQLKQWTI